VPTYIVSTAASRLMDLKARIAEGITTAHSQETGAQGFFAQVIFNEVPEGNHFLGGRPLSVELIFVHGFIRAGRTSLQKNRLIERIADVLVDVTARDRRHVWIYLSELAPAQMVEYGRALPEPGGEEMWLNAMPSADRDYIRGIG
jgi:phenylpyruvate tautomerase PptA (4-oxalocrotonate tautomerase family)